MFSIESTIEIIQSTFDGFNENVNNALSIITQAPESNSTMWGVVQGVQDVILPVAMTLAVLYFFMDFLNKSMMLEFVKWENVVKSLLKIMFCKVLMEHTMDLMNLIFKFIAELTSSIGLTGNVMIGNIDYDALTEAFKASAGLSERMQLYMKVLPITLVMYFIIKIISLIIYGRMIQIYIYTAFAPIPLSTIAGEGMNGTAKSFLKDYASVCLQGAVMIVAIGLYGAIVKDATITPGLEGLGTLLLLSMVLVFILIKSGDWAKKIVGR